MKLLLLPGDGVGPEVTAQAQRVLDRLRSDGLDVSVEHGALGGAAIDASGHPLPEDTLARAREADAVLMGAVGGPKWAGLAFGQRPEAGLLALRKGLGVYANLRPARLWPALADASPLKREIVDGLDLLFVRELLGGVYFGEPRGIEPLPGGGRRGVNTQSYTSEEVRRIARMAFELAAGRKAHLCSVDKANVMESGVLWREEVQALRDAEYPHIALTHMYADNCAMQLVRAPTQFDVILTDNLFGDLLSDEAGMLAGSLGMLPSAALGGAAGLYEPIHGSAPDIAGRGIANPCAAILSLGMALRHSLERPDLAERVERAVGAALEEGWRTPDLPGGSRPTDCEGMGTAILAAL